MTTTNTTYQYKPTTWHQAKDEVRRILIDRVRKTRGKPITYGDLCACLQAIQFAPDDAAFHAMLGEVSETEAAAGRGMLSALVVLKDGPSAGSPGGGFYTCAEGIGYQIPDKLKFWSDQLKAVIAFWLSNPNAS